MHLLVFTCHRFFAVGKLFNKVTELNYYSENLKYRDLEADERILLRRMPKNKGLNGWTVNN
jgi:hypothetical protein